MGVPYITFFPAVVFAAWFGGLRPALLATLLAFFLAWLLFVPPRFSLTIEHGGDLLGLCMFLIVGWAIAGLSGAMRSAQHRSTVAEYLARDQAEQLRTTLASIGDAVITTDTKGRITNLNPVAVALTGWSNSDAINQPIESVFRIINELTRESVESPTVQAQRKGVVVGLANHTLLITKDGTERPIDDSAAPIRSDAGEITGVVLVLRDVSERRRHEHQLRQSEQRKAGILDAALDCIISIDHEGRVLEFNPAAERTFGYTREEVIGRELASLIIPQAIREQHRHGLTRYLATGEGPVLNRRLELTGLRADGTELPVELTVTRIPTENPPVFTAHLRDITERNRLEDRLRQYVADLSEANRRKDEFLAMLAHELRNPLASIDYSKQLLSASPDQLSSVTDITL